MPNPARLVKVLATLLASMTIGAVVLMTMGHNPPIAGTFSLFTYESLPSVKKLLGSVPYQSKDRWNWIEIFYSGSNSGNIGQSSNGLPNSQDVNYHFCVYNGKGGNDGHIQLSEKWQNQNSVSSPNSWVGSDQAIRICVVADGRNIRPTDCQIKRIQVLVEELRRNFNIQPDSIFYPNDW